jgi:pimeloyl-ACP methyl ester carboxylesterase
MDPVHIIQLVQNRQFCPKLLIRLLYFFLKGFAYYFLDGVQHVRRVADHFKLPKFSLMGHSMGGGIACAYAATHPEQVTLNLLIMVRLRLDMTNLLKLTG